MTVTVNPEFVLQQIASGALDERLSEIIKAAEDRLVATRRSRTVAEYNIGDEVVVNDFCGTKYLRGHRAIVVGKNRTKLVIKLKHPTGRFARVVDGNLESAEVRVPASIIDHV